MKFDFINYENSINNLTSSIEKYYHLTPHHNSMKDIDEILSEKNYKNVIVILFDAMGSAIIEKNAKEDSILRTNKLKDFYSSYPPTTANCTVCYTTGMSALENGWLGWSTYFKDYNLTVDNFTNNESFTKEKIKNPIFRKTLLKTSYLGDRIHKENRDVKFTEIGPKGVMKVGAKTLFGFKLKILLTTLLHKKNYIYAYWNEPDTYMHENGTSNKGTKKIFDNIDKTLKFLQKTLKDTIIFVSADHGMIDVEPINLYEYKDIIGMLKCTPSCDSRTPFFFVKEESYKLFPVLFNKYFSEDFTLITKEEAIENHLFGYGTPHPLFNDIVGDYIAIAKSNKYFQMSENHRLFKGHHAGSLKDEYTIPLIVIKN